MFLKNFFVCYPSIVSKRYLWKSESFTVSIHWYFVFSWTLSRDNVVKIIIIVACAFWGPKHFQSFQSTGYKHPYKSIIMIAQTSFKPVNQLADSWELSSNILTDGRVIAKKKKKTDLLYECPASYSFHWRDLYICAFSCHIDWMNNGNWSKIIKHLIQLYEYYC